MEPAERRVVAHDRALLALMMADARRAPGVWRAKARWEGYARRIETEIARAGLADFRTNPRVLKGYAAGGVPEPALPRSAWKRALWRLAAEGPVARRIIAEQRLLTAGAHASGLKSAKAHARLVLDALARTGLAFTPPRGLDHGGAEDVFTWRGHTVTTAWVEHLARAAELYDHVPPEAVTRMMEVGPGLGFTTLAHRALNPGLGVVVNVDIPPVLYVSTQFLRSLPALDVVDYAATRDLERIEPEPAADGRLRVYMVAPWQTPRLAGALDLFLNAASFQEMDRETCAAYATEATRLAPGRAVLIGGIEGRAEPVPHAVDIDFVLGRFAPALPAKRIISGAWQAHYETGYVTYLLERDGAP